MEYFELKENRFLLFLPIHEMCLRRLVNPSKELKFSNQIVNWHAFIYLRREEKEKISRTDFLDFNLEIK